MKTLYLDTAYNQIVGICDERGQWQALSRESGQRSSALLHGHLHQLCEQSCVSAASIKRVIYHAGPGFYTGLRIAYGIAQVLRLEGVAVGGFYSHELPRALGHEQYRWITKAYRGEVFVYDGKSGQSQLMKEEAFLSHDWEGEVYVHHPSALDERMAPKLAHAKLTEALALDNMATVFSLVDERPLHYFRPPEEEFKPSL